MVWRIINYTHLNFAKLSIWLHICLEGIQIHFINKNCVLANSIYFFDVLLTCLCCDIKIQNFILLLWLLQLKVIFIFCYIKIIFIFVILKLFLLCCYGYYTVNSAILLWLLKNFLVICTQCRRYRIVILACTLCLTERY